MYKTQTSSIACLCQFLHRFFTARKKNVCLSQNALQRQTYLSSFMGTCSKCMQNLQVAFIDLALTMQDHIINKTSQTENSSTDSLHNWNTKHNIQHWGVVLVDWKETIQTKICAIHSQNTIYALNQIHSFTFCSMQQKWTAYTWALFNWKGHFGG